MNYILHLETSGKNCSVALSENGLLKTLREEAGSGYNHASLLTVLVEELLLSQKLKFEDLSAVCVNKGPGSYTGLRIGVSATKGLCYAKDLPMIAVDSLLSLAQLCLDNDSGSLNTLSENKPFYLCPMIDAKRMEVYTVIFDNELNVIEDISAKIIDSESLKKYINEKPFFIFGDGAEKCAETLKHPNLHYIPDINNSAKGLIKAAYQKFLNKDFEDVAYFEPFYLKDFVAGKPKVKGLK